MIILALIILIESAGNPLAYNKHSQARGLCQITPICLEEYNQYHKIKYTLDDLFNADINKKIGAWYLNRIRKHYLKGKGTLKDNLICYNFGYGGWRKWKQGKIKLPKETVDYITKYINLSH